MGVTKAKLYVTQSGWLNAKESLEDQLGIPHADGTLRYCSEKQVRSDHPEHANKYILPIETATGERWKCNHLVSGEIDYDNDWHEPDPDPPE